jgi:hypothetical protein
MENNQGVIMSEERNGINHKKEERDGEIRFTHCQHFAIEIMTTHVVNNWRLKS